MEMIKKYILNFLILLIVNSQTYSNSSTYTDSLIILSNNDINKNNLILSNGDTIIFFKLKYDVISNDSITTLFTNFIEKYQKNEIIYQQYNKINKLLILKDISYFSMDSKNFYITKSNNYFLIFSLIGLIIILFILFFFIKLKESTARLKSEIEYLITKIEEEYKPGIIKLNRLKLELIGKENNVNNPLGEINKFIIHEKEKLNDNIFCKYTNKHKLINYNILLNYLIDLNSICCRFLRIEYFGQSGEIKKFNTKDHFTINYYLNDALNVQIINCGWRDSDTKEVLKKAYVENINEK